MKVKSEREVAESCPTLSDPVDYSLPGSSIHGIFQARVLEWGAIAFSNTHTTINKIVNKNLLYSTGNSIQYSVMAYMGNESKRVDICICIGEGDGTPLQYSCLENPMDGGAW